jgi:hypothetical protein
MSYTYNLIFHPEQRGKFKFEVGSSYRHWSPCLSELSSNFRDTDITSVSWVMGIRGGEDTSVVDKFAVLVGFTIENLEILDYPEWPASYYYAYDLDMTVFKRFSHPSCSVQQALYIGQLYKFWYGNTEDCPCDPPTDLSIQTVGDFVACRFGQSDGSFLHRLSYKEDLFCNCTFLTGYEECATHTSYDMIGTKLLDKYESAVESV